MLHILSLCHLLPNRFKLTTWTVSLLRMLHDKIQLIINIHILIISIMNSFILTSWALNFDFIANLIFRFQIYLLFVNLDDHFDFRALPVLFWLVQALSLFGLIFCRWQAAGSHLLALLIINEVNQISFSDLFWRAVQFCKTLRWCWHFFSWGLLGNNWLRWNWFHLLPGHFTQTHLIHRFPLLDRSRGRH